MNVEMPTHGHDGDDGTPGVVHSHRQGNTLHSHSGMERAKGDYDIPSHVVCIRGEPEHDDVRVVCGGVRREGDFLECILAKGYVQYVFWRGGNVPADGLTSIFVPLAQVRWAAVAQLTYIVDD